MPRPQLELNSGTKGSRRAEKALVMKGGKAIDNRLYAVQLVKSIENIFPVVCHEGVCESARPPKHQHVNGKHLW